MIIIDAFLTQKYLEFRFSHSLKQVIARSKRTTDKTANLIEHIL